MLARPVRGLLRGLVTGPMGRADIGRSTHISRVIATLLALVGRGAMDREVADFLLTLVGRNASPHTITAYKSDLMRFAAYLREKEAPVTDVTGIRREDCIGFAAAMRADGFANATVARRYAAVRSWIYWLALRKRIEALDIPKHIHREGRALPHVPGPDAIAAMISSRDASGYCGARDRAILEFLYSTGCRAAELCDLRIGDIATDKRTARVVGKGRKERVVVLGSSARKALRAYLEDWRRPHHDAQSVVLVFLTRDGRKMSTRNLHKIVVRAALAANVKGVHPHSVRHATATHMVDHGANLIAVKDMLGHASLSSTQLYVHLSPSRILKEHKEHHPRNESGPQAGEPTGHAQGDGGG
jgi:site-specific recombinase XerD